jgi:hypothetical protein
MSYGIHYSGRPKHDALGILREKAPIFGSQGKMTLKMILVMISKE